MCNVMKTIEEVDLEKVFVEGDSHGVEDKIRELWLTDKRQQSKQFHADQAKNGKCIYKLYFDLEIIRIFIVTGKHGNQWSLITIRIGKYE